MAKVCRKAKSANAELLEVAAKSLEVAAAEKVAAAESLVAAAESLQVAAAGSLEVAAAESSPPSRRRTRALLGTGTRPGGESAHIATSR